MAVDGANFSTRVFAAGRANFVVRCTSDSIRDTVEMLFGDLGDGDPSSETTEIEISDLGGEWAVGFPGEDDRPVQPADWAAARLITGVSRLALDADPDRLHVHAAALSLDGLGVLISAESGTGKTTLATALAQRGWTYVSDEMVAVELDHPIARSFPKPLSLKPAGHALVPGALDAGVPLEVHGEDDSWVHIRASELAGGIAHEIDPRAIVILGVATDGAVDIERSPVALHPADAVVALMGQTMDPGRFGPNAVLALGRLAARCRCATLAIGPIESSVTALAALVRPAPEPQAVRVLATPDAFDLDGWRIPAGVQSIVIGERVVVHDPDGGTIVALDESGTATWEALHDAAPTWWSVEILRSDGVTAFLETLRTHGLVTRVPTEERTRR